MPNQDARSTASSTTLPPPEQELEFKGRLSESTVPFYSAKSSKSAKSSFPAASHAA